MNLNRTWIYVAGLLLLQGCKTELIVDSKQIPSSENGVTALGGVYVAGGPAVYKVKKKPGGAHQAEIVLERTDCSFVGLTGQGPYLYASCLNQTYINTPGGVFPLPKWAELIRIDLLRKKNDPARVVTVPIEGSSFFPNGMAVDAKGRIYVSNSYSFFAPAFGLPGSPAIVRFDVVDPKAFTVTQNTVLDAKYGGYNPNGIQIQGKTLWLASFNQLYQMTITAQGLTGVTKIYETKKSQYFDDLAVLPHGVLAVAEITNIFPSLVQVVYPGTSVPSTPVNQLSFVGTKGKHAGKLLHAHPFAPSIYPSSVTPFVDEVGPCLYVTDVMSGGVYRVSRK